MMIEINNKIYNFSKWYKFTRNSYKEQYYIDCWDKKYIDRSFKFETEEERDKIWEKIKND